MLNKTRRSSRSKNSFTLIEVLVMVVIMSLFVIISLPALSKAIGMEGRETCMSNLKDIGRAYLMYAQDHNGYGPAGEHHGRTYYYGAEKEGKKYQYKMTYRIFNSGEPAYAIGKLLTYGYLKNGMVYFCPDQPGTDDHQKKMAAWMSRGVTPKANVPYTIYSSYVSRDAEDGNGSPIKLTDHPDWAIVAGGNMCVKDAFSDFWHEDGFNVLYADGGVSFCNKVVIAYSGNNQRDDGIKARWEVLTSRRQDKGEVL